MAHTSNPINEQPRTEYDQITIAIQVTIAQITAEAVAVAMGAEEEPTLLADSVQTLAINQSSSDLRIQKPRINKTIRLLCRRTAVSLGKSLCSDSCFGTQLFRSYHIHYNLSASGNRVVRDSGCTSPASLHISSRFCSPTDGAWILRKIPHISGQVSQQLAGYNWICRQC
jgi:hypothetical protein